MRILVTGAAGYIGSHTCLALLQGGHEVVAVDNYVNSKEQVLPIVERLAGKRMTVCPGDIRDEDFLARTFQTHPVDFVIHFAALKAVAESVREPLKYFDNNLSGTVSLLKNMEKAGVRSIVFSSSATVYGQQDEMTPFPETLPLQPPANPYARTKVTMEGILTDLAAADSRWCVCLLRYFNPIGAHESGEIGEDPNGIPNNVMPILLRCARTGENFHICGTDYPTPDGTCIRDYIHVCDLAQGHLLAVEKLSGKTGRYVYNLGTGVGYSVRQIVRAFEKAAGKTLNVVESPRRAGDVPYLCASPEKAKKELDFRATRTLEDMCRDSWNWQQKNPHGYTRD